MSLLTPNPGLIFWMLVVFLLVVFILAKFAWKPIIKGLKDRENEIQGALDLAERTRAEMIQLKSDNEKLIAEANAVRDQILRDAKDAADRTILESKDKAAVEAQKMIESAREAIRNEQQVAVTKIRKEVATLSLEIAEKVLHRELKDKAAQEQLIAELASSARLN
ncbi:F0F1 ATP synthase subunit B [Dyadobacter fanqingshengii]|uniref:ATP synthase subunit b n=1 Tax=Dyadobacter fanqingshengii TaxID=2906443 RepID=A0A9X1PA43_9BACT|nr:F0F1 ATP synthase subunit B [Dyadobacter fanqingshengii]MCF0039507.1 F0F1 ATP synthase subunit B [Dyadobacter fanqingshengii]MCF2502953.1 F0F1 ATP synthase subunit B [Dyadobacter fanqingshengii]USJ33684.1 F0F1 ATP synthase subunit B [Dyadobacter fanqingshengii]